MHQLRALKTPFFLLFRIALFYHTDPIPDAVAILLSAIIKELEEVAFVNTDHLKEVNEEKVTALTYAGMLTSA